MLEISYFVSQVQKFLLDQDNIRALDCELPKIKPNYSKELPALPYSDLIKEAETELINLIEERAKFDEDIAKAIALKEIDKHVAPYVKQKKMHEKSISQTLDLLEIKYLRSKTKADQFYRNEEVYRKLQKAKDLQKSFKYLAGNENEI